jgi:hypothetical protein
MPDAVAPKRTYKKGTGAWKKAPPDAVRYSRMCGFADASSGRVSPVGGTSAPVSMSAMHSRFTSGAPVARGDGLVDWAYKQGVELYFDCRESARVELVRADGTPMLNLNTLVSNFFLGTEMTAGDVATAGGEAVLDEVVPGGSSGAPEWVSDAAQVTGAVFDMALAVLD